jgi:hypothetical protein
MGRDTSVLYDQGVVMCVSEDVVRRGALELRPAKDDLQIFNPETS